jgi:lysophospholipase L1-like esterase
MLARHNSAVVLGVLCILAFGGTAAAADLTIMPLGDSITLGLGNQITGELVPGGYRTRLYSDLHDAGFSFTFVGTSTDNPSPPLSQGGQTHHEGHGGYSISQIVNNLDGNDGSAGNNEGLWFHKPAPPDLILLHVGTVDIFLGSSAATTAQALDELIGQIVADAPTSHLFVASIPPFEIGDYYNQIVQAYDAQIRDVIVPKYQALGVNVIFVDQYSNFVDATGSVLHIGPDGVHPDAVGYDLMGATWAAALQQVIPMAEPVPVTGYNADVICDKDASVRFAQPFHAGTYAWFEAGAVDDNGVAHADGLPAGQTFVSPTGSRAAYQIQSANVNNVLQLGADQTGTLTLKTPAAYKTLYVLASSGDGTQTSVGGGNINFADGSTQVFSYNSFDWCNGSGGLHPEAVLGGPNGRADVGPSGTAFVYDQDRDFQIYETVIAIDPAHVGVAIASIDFTGAPDAYLSSIFGVSGQ